MTGNIAKIQPTDFGALNGWSNAEFDLALAAFKRSAAEILSSGHGFKRSSIFSGSREDWFPACNSALKTKSPRDFFEENFTPCRIEDESRPQGLFTGYYEPLAKGSRTKSERFHVPIYRQPPQLVAFPSDVEAISGLRYGRIVDQIPTSFFSRKQIETGALDGQGLEICWLENWVDAFFIHIQGSGRIELEDKTTLRLAFAAKNGQAYMSIGAALLAKGHGTAETMSMKFLRDWLDQNPEPGRELMWQNNSFIFFREIKVDDETLGAVGAAKVNLTPLCSMALDRTFWTYGTPFWLETSTPPEARGGSTSLARLMIGQDTGTAIRGALRGDVYWGWGEEAIINAGHMKSPGRMTALLPNAVARRLGY